MEQKTSKCIHFECESRVNKNFLGKRIYCDIHECQYKNCRAMAFNARFCGEHIWRINL